MIENPTEEQLRTLKGVVYLIKNKVNGKCYVGETLRRFVDRYNSCRWWEDPSNKYFENSITKYGREAFHLTIMDFNIESKSELLKLQNKYIIEFDTMFPNGYNFILDDEYGNKEFSEELKLKLAIAGSKGKVYRIKEIKSGEIFEFRCPLEIIRKYGVKEQNLHALLIGKRRTICGICLPETNPEQFFKVQPLKTLVDQNNSRYEFHNCDRFEKENQCPSGSIARVAHGQKFASRSKDGRIFRLEQTSLDDKRYLKSIGVIRGKQKYKSVTLTRIQDNQDFLIETKDIKNFPHLTYREIYTLTSKEQKTSKGFKLKEVVYL